MIETTQTYTTKNIDKEIFNSLVEVIEFDKITSSDIKIHDKLNPVLWDENEKLKPEIRKLLLLNAKRFIEFSGLENLKFNDIILAGSMANYNYTKNSDIDIHVVLDFNQISENEEFVKEFLDMKKELWKLKLPTKIKGHDIELYFQDSKENLVSNGIYSLIKDEWILKPTKKIIIADTDLIKKKVLEFKKLIDNLKKYKNSKNFLNLYEKLKSKIKKYRRSGLEREGEFSVENLVFKMLRNSGLLNKLSELKKEYLTKELSLNEN